MPVRVELTWRGEMATMVRLGLAQGGREAFLQQLRDGHDNYLPEGSELTSVDVRDDPASGSIIVTMTGRTPMQWRRVPGNELDEFRFDNSTIVWTPDAERPAGPYRDAPFAFEVPYHVASSETVLLPNGGRGFTIQGGNLDRTIAGARLSREVRIADGRAVSRTVFRRLQREVPASEIRAAAAPLRAMADADAFFRAPQGTLVQRASSAPVAAAGGSSGREEASALVDRGYQLLQSSDYDGASRAFREAAERAPSWSRPLANHAIVLIRQHDYAAAGNDTREGHRPRSR